MKCLTNSTKVGRPRSKAWSQIIFGAATHVGEGRLSGISPGGVLGTAWGGVATEHRGGLEGRTRETHQSFLHRYHARMRARRLPKMSMERGHHPRVRPQVDRGVGFSPITQARWCYATV